MENILYKNCVSVQLREMECLLTRREKYLSIWINMCYDRVWKIKLHLLHIMLFQLYFTINIISNTISKIG